jgi:4-amino-4-deoxy-L-arabinose transferase-like glycosyltransferase
MARELAGRRWAQLVAATAVLANPLYLATNALFQTVSFDQLAWMLATLLLVRLLRGARPRLWLGVGAVVGVGLLTKYTILLFVLGVAAGLAATSARAQLATPWPWLGVAVAALVWVPNLAWQVAHGWPTLEFVAASSAAERAETSVVELVLNWLLFVGPVLLPLALVGIGRLWNHRSDRPLAVAAATVVCCSSRCGRSPTTPDRCSRRCSRPGRSPGRRTGPAPGATARPGRGSHCSR